MGTEIGTLQRVLLQDRCEFKVYNSTDSAASTHLVYTPAQKTCYYLANRIFRCIYDLCH